MTAGAMQVAITNALKRVDRYAWLYMEGVTFMKRPGTDPTAAPMELITAVRNGRAAAIGDHR
jgi:hypothetical protein